MNAGKLNKRVTMRSETQVTDGTGNVTNSSTADTEIWGMVKPISAKRNLEEGREFNAVAFDVTIRYDANIVDNIGSYKLVYNSNVLHIHNFHTVDEENHFVKFTATKG